MYEPDAEDGRHYARLGRQDHRQAARAITDELRDHIANFDDFFRPMRNYFYWEPHCFDIPLCCSMRSLFDSLDGIDELTDKFHALVQATLDNWMRCCRS